MRLPLGAGTMRASPLARLGAWVNFPALAAVLVWSAVYPFSKYALHQFPLPAYVAFRPLIAALLTFAFLGLRGQSARIAAPDRPRLAVAALAGTVTFQVFLMLGLKHTSASHSALLNSASPLIGAALLLAIGLYRPDARSSVGLVVGFAGVAILLLGASGSSGASVYGDVLTLISAVGWVIVSTVPRPLVGRYGATAVTAWMILAAAVVTLPFGLTTLGEMRAHPPSLLAVGALCYSAALGMFMANVFWQRAVHHLGSTQTLAYLYLQPFASLLLSALLLGERLTPIQALGGVVALVGVGLVRR